MAKRLFIALPLPEPAKAELNSLVHACRSVAPGVRWVHPENMHVTLKFLGDVEAGQEEGLTGVLPDVGLSAPFTFNMAGVGAFPNQNRPRVIWTGLDLGRSEIAALAGRVDDLTSTQGFAREERPFSPHVTIGRVKQPGDFEALWQSVSAVPFTGMRIDAREVKLIQSRLTPKGPIYTTLVSFPLRGPND